MSVLAWLVIALLVLASAGCQATPAPVPDDPLGDHSFLTHQPCAPSCWYGLEPDKATAGDVYDTLKQLPFVDPGTIAESGTTWFDGKDVDDTAKAISYACSHPRDSNCGGVLTISQGRLKKLLFTVTYHLTFRMAAQQLDDPDFVEARPLWAEGGGCLVTLIWSEKGIYVGSIDRQGDAECRKIWDGGRVSPEMRVSQMGYVTASLLESGPKAFFGDAVPFPGFSSP